MSAPLSEHQSAASPDAPPFISVIINCYNSARFLEEALESVRAQTYADWELVFWDNQSTDESAAIFKRYDDPRFHYFYAPEHTFLGKAKTVAIEKARGEWLAFLDCDDLWLPHKLEQQVALIQEGGADLGLVYGRMEVLVEDEARETSVAKSALAASLASRHKPLPEGEVFEPLLAENFVPQPSVILRRDVYWSVGGVNPAFKHSWDYDLFLRVSKGWKLRALQEVCCKYRVHGTNLTHTQKEIGYQESIAMMSNFLPDPAAARAIRVYESIYAGYEIYSGHLFAGLTRLVKRGSLTIFAHKFFNFFWRGFLARIQTASTRSSRISK